MNKITYGASRNGLTTKITTMCALFNSDEVLMINRSNNWKGWAFPGGHIEPEESVIECVIREMKEETGLTVINPVFKGMIHFYDRSTGDRHIVFNFIAHQFEGELRNECSEGEICWIPRKNIASLKFAEGMEQRFHIFFNQGISEMYVVWTKEDGYLQKDLFVYSADM